MKSVVLLSAGLDSSVNFVMAHEQGEVELALTFDYGQRAAKKEIQAAAKLCAKYGVPHKIIELPFFADFTTTSLVNTKAKVPVATELDITSLDASQSSAEKVWVPNRNGIFLNIAAGFAEGVQASHVVCGFNLEEAQTFPDNSQDYVKATNQSLQFSTATNVIAHSFTIDMTKKEIVREVKKIGIQLDELWPCYYGYEKWCGECESCLRFNRALEEA